MKFGWKTNFLCCAVLFLTIGIRYINSSSADDTSKNFIKVLMSDAYTSFKESRKLTPDEMLNEQGYHCEVHNVTTRAGYILSLHRIPYGKTNKNSTAVRKPVIIMHGIGQSAIHWLLNSANNSLMVMLSERGYDIWLGNLRGGPFSHKHVTMKSDEYAFWDFGIEDQAEDVTYLIDYVLKATGQPKLFYIGFSLGTTTFFTAMTLYPQFNSKIILFVALAPVAFVTHATNPLLLLSRLPTTAKFFEYIRSTFQIGSFPNEKGENTLSQIFPHYCSLGVVTATICSVFVYSLLGADPGQLNSSQIPMILKYSPTTTALKVVIHYSQMAGAKRYQRYDYGIQNFQKYGRLIPPAFPVHKMTCPVSLTWSNNDILGDPNDVATMAGLLPNLVDNHRIPLDEFSHYDFTYGTDASDLVYRHLVSLFKKFRDLP